MEQSKRKTLEIKKHVATIHCSNHLSLLQRKISNALLFHAYPELLAKEEHEITVKQLCKIIGYHGNNHEVIKTSLRALVSTLMEWNIVNADTKEEDWTASTILASVRIKGPNCSYAYSPRMKAMLYQPKMYGTINIIIQAKFRSSYGLALYENCARYRDMNYTKWFDYQTFRKLMGVPSDKYVIFRDFKRRVLDKSVEEVNDYSELLVRLEVQRKGREVISIRFLLSRKQNTFSNNPSITHDLKLNENEKITPDENSQILQKLTGIIGLNEPLAKDLFKSYDAKVIEEKVNYVLTSSGYQQGKINRSLAGYLISALKNDYKSSVNLKKVTIRRESKKNEFEKSHDSHQKYLTKELLGQVAKMDNEQREKILNGFENYFQKVGGIFWNLYKSEGLGNPIVAEHFLKFVEIENKDLLVPFLTLEQFDHECNEKSKLQ